MNDITDINDLDTSMKSCAIYDNSLNTRIVVTWQLNRPYLVDAIVIIGTNEVNFMLSEFSLYVGYDPDYSKNTPCPGGPYAYPIDSTYNTN